MLGLGHDVVDVPAFAEQLGEPGSRMRNLFSRASYGRPLNGRGSSGMARRCILRPAGRARRPSSRRGARRFRVGRKEMATLHIRTRLTIFLGRASKYLTIPTACPTSCSHPRCDASCGNRWGCRLTGMANRAKCIFPSAMTELLHPRW